MLERMSEQPREFRRGEPVIWYADSHGRALDPSHPDAVQHTGTIDTVCRHPADDSQFVAYVVACRGGVSGGYLMTVRPEHQIALAT
uniref:hypothetical protein n=1 Tax=Nocardia suismassiliense TaxID=2077092 RepID=UPI003F490FB5